MMYEETNTLRVKQNRVCIKLQIRPILTDILNATRNTNKTQRL